MQTMPGAVAAVGTRLHGGAGDRALARLTTVALAVGLLVAAPGQCAGSPSATADEVRVEYLPWSLSPDGQSLLVWDARGMAVIDVKEGREAWRSPARFSDALTGVAGWSPSSDAVIWEAWNHGRRRPRLLYARVRCGMNVDLHMEQLPAKAGFLGMSACFGRSDGEVVVGKFVVSLTVDAFYVLHLSGSGSRPALAAKVLVRGDLQQDAPLGLLRIRSGHRLLVLGVKGVYLLDLDDGSVREVLNKAALREGLRSRWGDRGVGPVWGADFVLGPRTSRLYFTVVIPGKERGAAVCEVFRLWLGAGTPPELLGYVDGGWSPVAPVPGGQFVMRVADGEATPDASNRSVLPRHLLLLDAALSHPVRLTDGQAPDDLPVWSETLRRVIFRRNRSEIWSVSLGGGDARRLWRAKDTEPSAGRPANGAGG